MCVSYFTTAIIGVMAGMWPYGVLVMFTELYTAESLSQVYGALHDSFITHPSLSNSLSEYVVLAIK